MECETAELPSVESAFSSIEKMGGECDIGKNYLHGVDVRCGRPDIRSLLDEEVASASGPVSVFGESIIPFVPKQRLTFFDLVSGPDDLTQLARRSMIESAEMYRGVDVSIHLEKFGYAVSRFGTG
jgi:hypothetical protein